MLADYRVRRSEAPRGMTETEAAQVLLVRSVEEHAPGIMTLDVLSCATEKAGDPEAGISWLASRASHVVQALPASYRSILRATDLLERRSLLLLSVAVLIGLTSNYLGPSDKISVFLNPIVVLLIWNVAVYGVVVLLTFGHLRRGTLTKVP